MKKPELIPVLVMMAATSFVVKNASCGDEKGNGYRDERADISAVTGKTETPRKRGESTFECLRRNGVVRGKITRVLDGDTFDIKTICGKVRTRTPGNDCPESSYNKKCRKQGCNPADGKRATKNVKEMLGKNAEVTLEGAYKQKGGRIYAYPRMKNGKLIDLETVKRKWCKAWRGHPKWKEYKKYAW